jgi:transglutaminase-like putative cysteine protease
MVATSCMALAATGYFDRPALLVLMLGLAVRASAVLGFAVLRLPPAVVSFLVLAASAFIPIDFYLLSRNFLTATVHGVCFLTAIKIVTTRSNRDYIYTGAISLAGLLAAAMISAHPGFVAWLIVYIAFAIAALTSAEIRREIQKHDHSTISPVGTRIPWRLTAVALMATAGIVVMTAGIFLLVPRTMRNAGRLLPGSPRLTGFSNEIDLGGMGKIARDNRAVMHIRSVSGPSGGHGTSTSAGTSSGDPLPPDLKWRGSALTRFDGRRWWEPTRPARPITAAPSLAVVAARPQLSRRDGRRLLYHVDIRSADTRTLFLAGIPEFINIDVPVLYETREDAIRVPPQFRETLRYDVSAHLGAPLPQPLNDLDRTRYLQFPPLDSRIISLAREWSGTGSAMDRAIRIERHLQHDFKYKLDGPDYFVADPLADFLFVRKEGYCEYFASAMAVMLRSIGIPSRVATGFQSGYFNSVSGLTVVRASDAHAWVEAWIADPAGAARTGTWTTFDPTPYGSSPATHLSALAMYMDALDNTWREWIVSYDLGHQLLIAALFENSLRRFWHAMPNLAGYRWKSAMWGLAALAIAFSAPWLRRRLGWKPRARKKSGRSGSPSAATALYEQMIRRLARQGIHKPTSTTPREFAAGIPELAHFTDLYNSARFGGNAAEISRLGAVLKDFNVHPNLRHPSSG